MRLFVKADHQGRNCCKRTIPLSAKQTVLNRTADSIEKCCKWIKALNESDKVSSKEKVPSKKELQPLALNKG